jgi:putative membrane protein (TIGR04086 family)
MNYSDLNLPASSPKFQGVSYAKTAKSVTLGVIISLFSTVILLIIFALIINAVFGDPDGVLHIFTGIGASAGAMTGGFRASRINGSNGLAVGLVTGISTSVIIFIIMLFAAEPVSESVERDVPFRLIMVLCNIFFSCIGGIFAVNSSKGRKISAYSQRKK